MPEPSTLLKLRLGHRCFPVNLAKFLRTHFLKTPPGDCLWSFMKQMRQKMTKMLKIEVISSYLHVTMQYVLNKYVVKT